MWTPWNTADEELIAQIGPGEVTRAVPWDSLTDEQKEFQRTKMAIHAAMVTRVDTEIGNVLNQIDAMGATDDTVILFLSDNGCSSEQLIRGDGHDPTAPPGSANSYLCLGPGWSSCSNTPLRLHKSWVHEGGIASPLIVNWPNGIAAQNELRHDPCHFVDVLPTLVDLAGGTPSLPTGAPPLAGRSIAPAFENDGAVGHEFLYFNHNNNRAIRVDDWKLIATGTEGPWELYDMSTDRSEQNNLAEQDPDRALELAELWQETDDMYTAQRESAPPTDRQLI
jgi:arylsulfatase